MWESILEVLNYEYAQRALMASALVGVLCGLLGCFIVLRNMSLIGDALSHAILPGVVVAFMVAGHSVAAFFFGSVVAGLIAALLITWIQRNVKTKDDAAIGIVFSAMFALGIIGISVVTRKEGVHLDMKDFLFGNILGITSADLWLTSLITAFTIACVVGFYRYFFISTFQPVIAQTLGVPISLIHYFLMLLLSFAVVASLQSVGVILVVAMLIIPASTAHLLTNRLKVMLIIAAFIGLFSAVIGLVLAIYFETTPGPAMTLVAASGYVITVFLSPKKGLLWSWVRKGRNRKAIIEEDVLKKAVKMHESGVLTRTSLQKNMPYTDFRFSVAIRALISKGQIKVKGDALDITEKGIQRAYKTIRAHRLWETFLNKNTRLDEFQIHDEAERLEHHLPEKFLSDIEQEMGYPQIDPHGSAIPQKISENILYMADLETGKMGLVLTDQNASVLKLLWEKGITPNFVFEVTEVSKDFVKILFQNKELVLPITLAADVKVVLVN